MFREADELDRKFLANPHQGQSFMDRLIKNKSVDLRDNIKVTDFENGYGHITAIDEHKIFKKS